MTLQIGKPIPAGSVHLLREGDWLLHEKYGLSRFFDECGGRGDGWVIVECADGKDAGCRPSSLTYLGRPDPEDDGFMPNPGWNPAGDLVVEVRFRNGDVVGDVQAERWSWKSFPTGDLIITHWKPAVDHGSRPAMPVVPGGDVVLTATERLARDIRTQVECSSANLIKSGADADMVRICLGHFNDLADRVAALSGHGAGGMSGPCKRPQQCNRVGSFYQTCGYGKCELAPHPTAADDARGGETAWLVERTDGHMPGPYAHFFGRQVFWLPNIFTATRFATRDEAEATDEVRLSGGVVKAVEHIFDLTLPDALASPAAPPSPGYDDAQAAECAQDHIGEPNEMVSAQPHKGEGLRVDDLATNRRRGAGDL